MGLGPETTSVTRFARQRLLLPRWSVCVRRSVPTEPGLIFVPHVTKHRVDDVISD
jgi:hypothetical protein